MAQNAGIQVPIGFLADLTVVTQAFQSMTDNIYTAFAALTESIDALFVVTASVAAANIKDAINGVGGSLKPLAVQVDTAAITGQVAAATNAATASAAANMALPSNMLTSDAAMKKILAPQKTTDTTTRAGAPAVAPVSGLATAVSGIAKVAGPLLGIYSAAMIAKKGVAFLKDSLDTFAEVSDKLEITGNVLKDMGASDTQIKKNEEFMKSLALSTGFSVGDISTGMAGLTIKTGDASEAVSALQASMNVARLRGMSLAQSSNMVYQAMMGQKRSMNQLGVGYMQGKSQVEILNAILGKVGGTLDAVADDFETSKMRVASSMELMKASVGQSLSGIMTNANEAGSGFAASMIVIFDQISKNLGANTTDWRTWGAEVGIVLGGIVQVITGVVKAAIAQLTWLMNSAMNIIKWIATENSVSKTDGLMAGIHAANSEYGINQTQTNKDLLDASVKDAALIITGENNIGHASTIAATAIKNQADLFAKAKTDNKGIYDAAQKTAEANAAAAKALKDQTKSLKTNLDIMKAINIQGVDAGPFSQFLGGISKANLTPQVALAKAAVAAVPKPAALTVPKPAAKVVAPKDSKIKVEIYSTYNKNQDDYSNTGGKAPLVLPPDFADRVAKSLASRIAGGAYAQPFTYSVGGD